MDAPVRRTDRRVESTVAKPGAISDCNGIRKGLWQGRDDIIGYLAYRFRRPVLGCGFDDALLRTVHVFRCESIGAFDHLQRIDSLCLGVLFQLCSQESDLPSKRVRFGRFP